MRNVIGFLRHPIKRIGDFTPDQFTIRKTFNQEIICGEQLKREPHSLFTSEAIRIAILIAHTRTENFSDCLLSDTYPVIVY